MKPKYIIIFLISLILSYFAIHQYREHHRKMPANIGIGVSDTIELKGK